MIANHPNRATPTRGGFSLIEVLFAVFILALGLLGLAAVFPAVIAQQRQASDTTLGLIAESAITSIFDVGDDLVDWQVIGLDYALSASGRPQSCSGSSMFGGLDPSNIQFLWEVDWNWEGVPASVFQEFARSGLLAVGGVEYRCNNGNVLAIAGSYDPTLIPVSARLYPPPYSGNTPRFIWDFVMRRTPADQIEIAVFVRPIDSGIRVPAGFSLSDVLTGNRVASSEFRLPITVDSTGIPAGNGLPTNRYAVPLEMAVLVPDERLDHLQLTGAPGSNTDLTTSRSLLAQVGQRFVDNLGVVRTVIGVSEATPDPAGSSFEIIVDPPFLASQAGPIQDTSDLGERASKVRQVVFTPQVPVAVFTRVIQ